MRLQRCTPEEQGVGSRAILDFLEAVNGQKHEFHSFMLVKNGCVVAERWWAPYAPQYRHKLFSLSKSFTSVGIGIAADEGLLSPGTLVSDIFKAEMDALGPRTDEKMRRMTIKHLLTMTTGMEYENWQYGGEMTNIVGFLSSHVKNEPGTAFFYNTLATYMLSAAVTRLTGQTLASWLAPRLFEPLGIKAYWDEDPATGVSLGGFGLNATTEDIAVFGQMVLQKGRWGGRQLVSESWIEAATSKQADNGTDKEDDWAQGYGYQFWRCCPEGVFRGDGAFGQFCVVDPATQTVIAATGNVDMQKALKLMCKLLADLKTQTNDARAAAALAAYDGFSHLAVDENAEPYPAFRAQYALAPANNAQRLYAPLEVQLPFRIACFDFGSDECVMALFEDMTRPASSAYRFVNKEWTISAAAYPQPGDTASRVATYGAWADNTFTAHIWHFETPSRIELQFTFSADMGEADVRIRAGGFDAQFAELGKAIRKG